MKPDEIVRECNLLALTLATNCTLALAKQGLLPADQAQYCADEMKRVAELVDQAMDQEALPPILARQLHAVAELIRPQE